MRNEIAWRTYQQVDRDIGAHVYIVYAQYDDGCLIVTYVGGTVNRVTRSYVFRLIDCKESQIIDRS